MPKGSKQRERRPTTAELKALYKHAGEINAELPVIVELAVETAMRRSELVMLRKDQVRGESCIPRRHEERRAPIRSAVKAGGGTLGWIADAD